MNYPSSKVVKGVLPMEGVVKVFKSGVGIYEDGWGKLLLGYFSLLAVLGNKLICGWGCPFGWYSWFLEKASLFGIRVNRGRCNDCGACVRVCPFDAAAGRVAGKSAADCFSCARCLRVCTVDAIDYGRCSPWPKNRGTSTK